MSEPCQRCGEADEDRRTLVMECFYEMNELGVPFKKTHGGYTLRVCKDCRADWMAAIKTWFETKPARESCGSGIFVRRNGAVVEITEEEWRAEHGDDEPCRVRR